MRNDIVYSLGAALVLGAYILFYEKRWLAPGYFTVWAMCFTAAVVMLTMKISFDSRILRWFGQHLFGIYIIQRIPFMVLPCFPYFVEHKYAFLLVSYAVILPLALLMDTLTEALLAPARRRLDGRY